MADIIASDGDDHTGPHAPSTALSVADGPRPPITGALQSRVMINSSAAAASRRVAPASTGPGDAAAAAAVSIVDRAPAGAVGSMTVETSTISDAALSKMSATQLRQALLRERDASIHWQQQYRDVSSLYQHLMSSRDGQHAAPSQREAANGADARKITLLRSQNMQLERQVCSCFILYDM